MSFNCDHCGLQNNEIQSGGKTQVRYFDRVDVKSQFKSRKFLGFRFGIKVFD